MPLFSIYNLTNIVCKKEKTHASKMIPTILPQNDSIGYTLQRRLWCPYMYMLYNCDNTARELTLASLTKKNFNIHNTFKKKTLNSYVSGALYEVISKK